MRLAVTADLHWGMSRPGDRATRELAEKVRDLAPDAFAVAGDVGEGPEWGRCLDLFSGLGCARLVLPGNHDLWVRNPDHSSLYQYEQKLPRWAAEAGFHYLDQAPWIAGALAVVGSINWYDYSFADPEVEREIPDARQMYREKRFPNGCHNDGRFVQLGMSDDAFTRRVVERFQSHLAELPREVSHVVAVQHHPPVRELFYPTPLTNTYQKVWLAYTGNRRMQDAVLSDPRIQSVLCGHTHAACEAEVQGRQCINIGGDYDFKRLVLLDTDTGARQAWEFGR